jgi:aspartate carbamoyltransferase catalytic subunit
MPENGNGGLLLDVLSADQFTPSHIENLTRRADQFQRKKEVRDAHTQLEEQFRKFGVLTAYFWFDERSTRTSGSFNTARDLLGLTFQGQLNAAETSSTGKGESFEDTMSAINAQLSFYGGGVVIMRTAEEGQPEKAAAILDLPVINAGDGQNQHPTQALLDIYTIKRRLGRLDNLHVVMGGDPRYSRTIHSLAQVLTLEDGIKIDFVGDKELWVDDKTKALLESRGIEYNETTDMNALTKADVIYWTRFQKERLKLSKWRINKIAHRYAKEFSITEDIVREMQEHAIIMHPLPRGPELPESIDNDPRAVYKKEQMENGVAIRAALIEMILRHLYVKRSNEG